MTLMHPAFNTNGNSKRKKIKFKSAAAKQEAMKLDRDWEDLKRRHPSSNGLKSPTTLTYTLAPPSGRSSNRHIPSLGDGVGNGAAKPVKQYTGDKIIGIGTLHKSNAVPVFSSDEAKDMASMRR